MPSPQAWNLDAYTRNNPLKYTDFDGLEIDVKCKTDQQCTQPIDDLNKRKGVQFQTKLVDGKLQVVGKVDPSQLSKSELALYNAIIDTKNVATLNVVPFSSDVMFGYSGLNDVGRDGKPNPTAGVNTLDRAVLNQLDKTDPALAGEVVAHEAMEAAYVGVAQGFTSLHGAGLVTSGFLLHFPW